MDGPKAPISVKMATNCLVRLAPDSKHESDRALEHADNKASKKGRPHFSGGTLIAPYYVTIAALAGTFGPWQTTRRNDVI